MEKVFLAISMCLLLFSCKKNDTQNKSNNPEQIAETAIIQKSFIDGKWLSEVNAKMSSKESNQNPYVEVETNSDNILVNINPNGDLSKSIKFQSKIVKNGDTISYVNPHTHKEDSFVKMPNGEIRYYSSGGFTTLIPFDKKYSE